MSNEARETVDRILERARVSFSTTYRGESRTRDEVIRAIDEATNTVQLDAIVESYLASIGQAEQARGESYGETAARLGGDDVLERAEARWFELGA